MLRWYIEGENNHMCYDMKLIMAPWQALRFWDEFRSTNIIHCSAYISKALKLVNLTAPSLCQSADQRYAGIGCQLHHLKAKDLMMGKVIKMQLKNDTVDLRSNASASIENRGRTSFFESPGVFLMFFYLTKFGRNGFGSIENRSPTAWFSGPMTNFTLRGTSLVATKRLYKRVCSKSRASGLGSPSKKKSDLRV